MIFQISFITKQCLEVFGNVFKTPWISGEIKDTNTNYGGFDYEASRVVFINGNIDPW